MVTDNFTYPADIFPSARYYAADLADQPIVLTDHHGVPSVKANQLMPEPHAERLRKMTVQSIVIPPS